MGGLNLWGDAVAPQRLLGESERHEMGELELTGKLSILLVGLDLTADEWRSPIGLHMDGCEPFLQTRAPEVVAPVRAGERPPARLLAARVVPLADGGPVFFGASTEDLSNRLRDDLEFNESLSLSLWDVPDSAPVLAIELLAHRDRAVSKDWEATGWATDPFQDFQRGGRFVGFRPALSEWLELAGLNLTLSVAELLAVELACADSMKTIPDLVIMSNETIRGRALVEGLRIHVEADRGARMRSLVDAREPEDCAEEAQAWGVIWKWDAVSLVDAPAVKGSCIAIREDSREVYLNLNALSSNHDYIGAGGSELVYEALAYVGYRASITRDFGAILEALRDRADETKYLGLLRLVEDIRAAAVYRALLRRETFRMERFETWTYGSQLRSQLFCRAQDEIDAVSSELELAAKVVDEIVRRKQEEAVAKQVDAKLVATAKADKRTGQIDLWATAFAVALSLFTAIGLFASLAAIPRDGAGTLFGTWAVPAAVTFLLTVLIMVLALVQVRWFTSAQESGGGSRLTAVVRILWSAAGARLRLAGGWVARALHFTARAEADAPASGPKAD